MFLVLSIRSELLRVPYVNQTRLEVEVRLNEISFEMISNFSLLLLSI